MMIELLGNFPKAVYNTGKRASEYFNRKGDLRNIQHLKYWGLKDVLHEKYKFSLEESTETAEFLRSILEVNIFL